MMLKALRLWRYVVQSKNLHRSTVRRIRQAVPSVKDTLWIDPYVMAFFDGLWQPFLSRWIDKTGAMLSTEDMNYIFLRSYSKATGVSAVNIKHARARAAMSENNTQTSGLLEGLAMGRFLVTQDPAHLKPIQAKVDVEYVRVREAGQVVQRATAKPEDDAEIYRACILPVTLGQQITRILGLGNNPFKA